MINDVKLYCESNIIRCVFLFTVNPYSKLPHRLAARSTILEIRECRAKCRAFKCGSAKCRVFKCSSSKCHWSLSWQFWQSGGRNLRGKASGASAEQLGVCIYYLLSISFIKIIHHKSYIYINSIYLFKWSKQENIKKTFI